MIRVIELAAIRPHEASAPERNGVADLHDAAARWRAPAVDADAGRSALANVVQFSRVRRDGAAAAVAPELSTALRPTIVAAPSRRALWWTALLLASTAAHVALYLPFGREPPPMASLGEITISVEIVPGVNEAAGLIPDKGESAASNPAPAQAPDAVAEQPQEQPTTEVAKIEPPREQPPAPVEPAEVRTEAPPQQVAEKPEPAEKPPEQVAALPAEHEPSPPQPVAPVEATPEPAAPAQVQAAPLVTAAPAAELQVAVNPETPPTVTTTTRATAQPVAPPPQAEPKPIKPEFKKPEFKKPEHKKPEHKKPEPKKPPVARAKRTPETRTAAVRGERNESRSTSPASTAAGGRGRGRSESNSNYAGLVHARLRQYLRYPEDARSRGERGTASVAFTLDAAGKVTSVRLVRGAGSAALDQEATAVVRRASPFPAPPSGRGQSFTAPVGFNFR